MCLIVLLVAMLIGGLGMIFSAYGLMLALITFGIALVFCGMLSSKKWLSNLSVITLFGLIIYDIVLFFIKGFGTGILGIVLGLIGFVVACYLIDKLNLGNKDTKDNENDKD